MKAFVQRRLKEAGGFRTSKEMKHFMELCQEEYKFQTVSYLRDGGVEMVVARYNEDVEWLYEYPFNRFSVFLYEKGPFPAELVFSKSLTRIRLLNVGREYHTYLYHIIQKYDNLPEITLFFPGSLRAPHKMERAKMLIRYVIESKKAIENLFPDRDELPDLYNFFLEEYKGTDPKNIELNDDSRLYPSPIRPFGKWFHSHFPKGQRIRGVWWNGVLVATREQIRKTPLHVYKSILSELAVHSNPEVGHYMERAWSALLTT